MLTIDRLANCSHLKQANTGLKLALALCSLIFCICADSVLTSAAVFILMSLLVVGKGKTPARDYFRLLTIPFWFILIGVLTVAVNFVSTPQGVLSFPLAHGFVAVTADGAVSALRLFLRCFGCVSCLYFLALTTPMHLLLAFLARLHVPQFFLELMLLIYRFIFLLFDFAHAMSLSQKSRLGEANFAARLRGLSAIAATLFLRALKRSEEILTAMESRLYDGSIPVAYEEPPLGRKYTVGAALVLAAELFTAFLPKL